MKTNITGTTAISQVSTPNHRVVSRDEWVAERKTLLAREKELTRFGDQIARERRALPCVRIDKTYTFDTPVGRRTLADLFDGHRQLLVQHFMLAPGWEQGCKNCSYMADHTDGATVHLAQRDVIFVAVSRAAVRDRAFSPAHGLEVPMGVLARQRLQSRFPRQLHSRRDGQWQG